MTSTTPPRGIGQTVLSYAKGTVTRYKRLHLYGKLAFWSWVAFDVVLVIAIIILTPARIAQFLHDQATNLSHMRFGWLILALVIVGVSFPPLIGHTTLSTLCGFAYGMKGFFITASASVIGSALVFVLLRVLFQKRLRKWSKDNAKWHALQQVVKAKGLPLIILIRMSPFPPWVYSNSLLASIDSVALWQFVIATMFTFPKLLLHVFIGSQMAPLSDGETRNRMDTRTKIIDVLFICIGIVIAVSASVIVYRSVQNHIRKLEGLPAEVDELAADALADAVDEQAPLLRSTSPRPDQEA